MSSSRTVSPAPGPLHGRIRVPGDKSISHRAVMLNCAGAGEAYVSGLADGRDVASTVAAMRGLGAEIHAEGLRALRIVGREMLFKEPKTSIDCGNSGTTMRLLAGLLAGQRFDSVLDGDASLRRRPMGRIAVPLARMGARIRTDDGHAPVRIRGATLHGHEHRLEVASAQVKSAILLAGLQAVGRTSVAEPLPSRDHTERMLASMGVRVRRGQAGVSVDGPVVPACTDLEVCGDPSSAAFFVVATVLVDGSDLTIANVCLNPTRTGFVGILRRMGAHVETLVRHQTCGEPVGEIRVRSSALRGIEIGAADVPACVDELPVLAVAAAVAEGTTVISGAGELRVKESDRIRAVAAMLDTLGADVVEHEDGLEIHGGRHLVGGVQVVTHDDHRLVMSAAVAALVCRHPVVIEAPDAAAISFPGFFEQMEALHR